MAALVDSSLWVHQLRRSGEIPDKRARVEALLPTYDITDAVWQQAISLADRGRATGVTVPLADLLVFACARVHELDLAHDDAHFDVLATLDAQDLTAGSLPASAAPA